MSSLQELIARAQASAHAGDALGRLHNEGNFLHLVFDRAGGAYLAPTYDGVLDELIAAHKRRREAMEFAQDPELAARLAFLPYPEVAIPVRSFGSTRVAILDSGVLREHPLLAGAVEEVHDLTGEGEADEIGHGTIEAIRQVWHDDAARLVIVKVFRRDATTTVSILADAFQLLRGLDVGFIFMAGGVDVSRHPDAEVVCAMAKELVAEKSMAYGGFVATRGNIGRAGRWCPAEADGVVGVAVVDRDTMQNRLGTVGGLTVAQKGDYTSFPDITPLPVVDFFLQGARALLGRGESELAERLARRALEVATAGRERAVAHHLLGAIAYGRGAFAEAEAAFRAAVEADPAHDVSYNLAATLAALKRYDEAETLFRRAVTLYPGDAVVHRNLAAFLENARGDRAQAVEPLRRAAEISGQSHELLALGARAFYAGDFDASIAANEAVCTADPTYAAALYNIAIAWALKGDADTARTWLDAYASASSDTSMHRYDAAAAAPVFSHPDEVERRARLRYAFDPDRRSIAHLEPLLGAIVGVPLPRFRLRSVLGVPSSLEAAIGSLSEGDRAALRRAAFWLVPRLLFLEPADLHTQAALVLCALAAAAEPGDAADAWIAAGRLLAHCGEFRSSIAAYDRALALLPEISVRGVEEVLVEKGFAQIAQEEWDDAQQTLSKVFETSLHLKQEHVDVIQTALTPRVFCGLAAIALERNDVAAALEHLQKALAGGLTGAEVQLFEAAAAMAAGDEEAALAIVLRIARESAHGVVARREVLRLIRSHRLLDAIRLEGMPLFELMRTYHAYADHHDVGLCERRPSLRRPLPPPSQAATYVVALVGTGIEPEDEDLARHVAEGVDFTGEGLDDRNGATSEQLRMMIEAGTVARFLNVKVLGGDGTGSREALVRGLLWAAGRKANLIVVNAFTDHDDGHLAGIAGAIGARTVILAAPAPQGHGRGFPGAVSGRVILAPPYD